MRRRFGRGLGRLGRRALGRVPPLLIRANQLLAIGSFEQAAAILEDLARGAQARGGRRAPQLLLEAGRARLLAGHTPAALVLLERGLRLLAARSALLHLPLAGRRVVAELDSRGLESEAQQMRQLLASLGAPTGATPPSATPVAQHGSLPTHCPSCGGPVHPAEVEWLSADTAECEYCGSPIRAE